MLVTAPTSRAMIRKMEKFLGLSLLEVGAAVRFVVSNPIAVATGIRSQSDPKRKRASLCAMSECTRMGRANASRSASVHFVWRLLSDGLWSGRAEFKA